MNIDRLVKFLDSRHRVSSLFYSGRLLYFPDTFNSVACVLTPPIGVARISWSSGTVACSSACDVLLPVLVFLSTNEIKFETEGCSFSLVFFVSM